MKKFVVLLIVAAAAALLSQQPAQADEILPSNDNDVNNVWTSTYLQGPGTTLHVPESWIKVSFPGQPVNHTVHIYDGVFCLANGGSIDTAWYSSNFDTLGECQQNDALHRINYDFCNNTTASPSCVQHNSTYMAHMDWTPVFVPASSFTYEPDRDISSTYVHVYYHGRSDINAADYFGSRNNSFRLRANGGSVGFTGTKSGVRYAIAIQNRNKSLGNSHEDTMNLHFASTCDYAGGRLALEWFDADWHGSPYETDIAFSVIDETTGQVVPLWSSANNGVRIDNNGVVSDGAYLGGNGSTIYRAWFTPIANHRYTWRWFNVDRNNGVQVYSPFDGTNYDYTCKFNAAGCQIQSAPGSVVAGTNFSVSVRVYNYGIKNWNASGTNPYRLGSANPRDNTVWGRSRAPLSSNVPSGSTQLLTFNVTAPNTLGNRNMSWQMVQEGVEWFGNVCSTNILIVAPPPPTQFDYIPNNPVISTSHPKYYAQRPFTVRHTVRNANVASGNGQNYTQTLRITSGRSYLVGSPADPVFNNQPGLAPGQSSQRQNQFTVRGNAPHNGQVCFRLHVSPGAGESPPSNVVTDPADLSGERCLTIYNRQYNITELNTGPSTIDITPSVLTPGGPIQLVANICNTEVVPAAGGTAVEGGQTTRVILSQSSNVTGATVDVQTDFSRGAAGCQTFTFNGTTSPALTPGDNACIRVRVNRNRGFADGFALLGALPPNPDSTFCTGVAEQPYFVVDRGTIWAGGVMHPTDVVATGGWCSGADPTTGFIRGVLKGTTGAFTSYASIARGDISGIRTGNEADLNYLTFQNSPGKGNYYDDNKVGRCLTDYYKYLTHGPNVLASLPASFPDGTHDSGQYFVDVGGPGNGEVALGDINLSDGGINKQIVLVVNGDVLIDGNITFDMSHDGTSPEYSADHHNNSTDDDIPMFLLVASGKIDIQANVTHLSGIYISREGAIDTCSDQPAAISEKLSTAVCSNQLVVKGKFYAKDIHLRRTAGGVLGTGPNGSGPAEIFNDGEESFLSNLPVSTEILTEIRINSITELPPIF